MLYAYVFASFNRPDKIRPDTFGAWCGVLARTTAQRAVALLGQGVDERPAARRGGGARRW